MHCVSSHALCQLACAVSAGVRCVSCVSWRALCQLACAVSAGVRCVSSRALCQLACAVPARMRVVPFCMSLRQPLCVTQACDTRLVARLCTPTSEEPPSCHCAHRFKLTELDKYRADGVTPVGVGAEPAPLPPLVKDVPKITVPKAPATNKRQLKADKENEAGTSEVIIKRETKHPRTAHLTGQCNVTAPNKLLCTNEVVCNQLGSVNPCQYT